MFQARVARRVASGVAAGEEEPDTETEAPYRQVLSQLRTIGKKKQAPINRVGASIKGVHSILGQFKVLIYKK